MLLRLLLRVSNTRSGTDTRWCGAGDDAERDWMDGAADHSRLTMVVKPFSSTGQAARVEQMLALNEEVRQASQGDGQAINPHP